ncbi:MAG: hypothetical protein FWD76_00150 [Firmicutes bacterium]|nr:hypothetical protein [Bacillota bacterium]
MATNQTTQYETQATGKPMSTGALGQPAALQPNKPSAASPELSKAELKAQKKAAKKESKQQDRHWWQVFKAEPIEIPVPIYDQQDKTVAKDVELATHKLNQTLSGIESQLDKVDEQNQMLLMTLGTLKENNQVLLQQVQTLGDTNKQLFQKLQASRKRERIIKVIAALSSCIALGIGIYNVYKLFFMK